MLDALYIGATGMQAQQLGIDTIANNLTNVNTAAFKKARLNFVDLMTMDPAARATRLANSGNDVGESDPLAPAARLGLGVGIGSTSTLFDQGPINQTNSPFDLAVNGDGFLAVTLADGSTAYTRGGTLQVNSDGMLATQAGLPLKPAISVPTTATQLTIAGDGSVTAMIPGQSQPATLGQIQMARFTNESALTVESGNLFTANENSGEPITGNAGQDGIGTLQQGALEASNVTLTDELVNLIIAQRGYEASVKVVQAADDMLGMTNNLRRE